MIVLLLVPVIFALAGRRAGHGGIDKTKPDKPVIRDQPSADEPSPAGASDIRVNQSKTDATRWLPPA